MENRGALVGNAQWEPEHGVGSLGSHSKCRLKPGALQMLHSFQGSREVCSDLAEGSREN